jgi:hypothetical protein
MTFRPLFTLCLATAVASSAPLAAQHFSFRAGDPANDRRDERRVSRTAVRHVHDAVRSTFVVEQPSDDPCRDQGWDDDHYRFCEVRDYTLPAGALTVDAGRNGGIRIEGADRHDIRVVAVITAQARRQDDAKQLASEVQVQAGGGKVSASGPESRSRQWWSVSYRITVPRRTDLDLRASNGGIAITAVEGTIRFDTTNGGVRLTDLSGDVRGETRNGGLTVTLGGNRWNGAGLDVETSNGGVTLMLPENYNADLTTRTVNGGFRTEFPMTVQGELSPRRGLTTTLGSGGPPVRVRTTNGGVTIRKRM